MDDLDLSVCAVLLAEAANIGLTPVVNPAVRTLTRRAAPARGRRV
jgi:hypothetical protein